jgi:hypothetical protein
MRHKEIKTKGYDALQIIKIFLTKIYLFLTP